MHENTADAHPRARAFVKERAREQANDETAEENHDGVDDDGERARSEGGRRVVKQNGELRETLMYLTREIINKALRRPA